MVPAADFTALLLSPCIQSALVLYQSFSFSSLSLFHSFILFQREQNKEKKGEKLTDIALLEHLDLEALRTQGHQHHQRHQKDPVAHLQLTKKNPKKTKSESRGSGD